MPITAAMVARSRAVAEPRWSPDGRRLGWVEGFAGRADVVVGPADGSEPPRVVTADAPVTPVGAYGGGAWCWVGDDHVAVASEEGPLVLVPVAGGPVRILARHGRAVSPAASPEGRWVAFVLERDDSCDIAVVPVDGSSWPARVSGGADYAWDPAVARDASRIAWHEWDLTGMSWDASRIVVAGRDGSDPAIVAGGDGIATGQPRFSPCGEQLAYVSDETGWWNVWATDTTGTSAPVLAEPCEHVEPSWGPGQRSFAWRPDGAAIALNRNDDGFGRLVVASVGLDADRSPVERSAGWHHGLDWGHAGIVCVRSGARTPSTVTVLDPDASTRRGVARGPAGGFEAAGLVEPEPVTWRGDDGATVHGLLYRPESPAPGGEAAPLLVDVHGGPTGQATASWNPRAQYFVSRGWAVLAPDPRGSSGHGRAYAQALAGGWGEVDVADTIAGIRVVGPRGWGDPRRVAAIGGSAGGLTVLLLCAQHGDALRAGVSMYGVTDLFELARTTHRFESRYLDRIVGELPRDSDRYRARSPVTHAGAIRVPVLVLQGDADRVVPPGQAQAVVDAIRSTGGAVEHHVYEGEGHGWSRPETVADALTRTEAFLRRWVLER